MEVFGLTTFMLTMSLTPGPNVIMIAQSGANFGFRKSIPHMLGITFGFTLLALLVAMGLGTAIIEEYPFALTVIRYLGAIYLSYLAFRTLLASSASQDTSIDHRALSFYESFLFQFANPKGWVMAFLASAFFAKEHTPGFQDYVIYGAILFLILGPCVVVWNVFGLSLRQGLKRPAYKKIFNVVMAILLLLSAADLILSKGNILS